MVYRLWSMVKPLPLPLPIMGRGWGRGLTYVFPSAWSRSQRMSSMSSIPIERRMKSGVTPAAACSAGESWARVVLAGWIARLFASPTFARWPLAGRRDLA